MNKETANQIVQTMALISPSELKSAMVVLRDAGRREFGDEYDDACLELKKLINDQVDVNQIGVVATYALVCSVNNTDARLTRLVMACAADQWLQEKQLAM